MAEAIKILKKNNLKVTHQRVKVLEYLMNNHIHPTADKINSDLSEQGEIISFATVYNTLALLVKEGLLNKLDGFGDQAAYDINLHDHMHFSCRSCGEVQDVEVSKFNYKDIDLEGNQVNGFSGYLFGICEKCNKEVKSNNLLKLFSQKVKIFNRRK